MKQAHFDNDTATLLARWARVTEPRGRQAVLRLVEHAARLCEGTDTANVEPPAPGKPLPPEFRVERHPDNTAIDEEGRVMPMTSDQVARHMERVINEGQLLVAVFRHGDELAVQSLCPPSWDLVGCLETAARGYRKTLENVS